MNRITLLGTIVAMSILPASSSAGLLKGRFELDRVNRRLQGHVVDYTNNHGSDNRLYSAALCEKRDLYVYLPPCYDAGKQYPVMFWLHGFAQDEHSFIGQVVGPLDNMIACGKLPPMIVVAPDGSLKGTMCLRSAGSFYLNTKAGCFEDYIINDVWNFVTTNYPIRPEREAHVLAGVSMGGGAAYNLSIKYKSRFKVALAFFPPLNTRWLDCHCHYMANFDPCCWAWRTDFTHGHEVVGRFYGVITIRLKHVIKPLYDIGPDTASEVAKDNPIEMIDSYGLKEGDLSLWVGYGRKDQFNIDAQVESFLHRARERGLTVTVSYDPNGKHDAATALRLFPGAVEWLAPLVAPYARSTTAEPPPAAVK